MQCPVCLTDNPAGALFCSACGARLAGSSQPEAPKPTSVQPMPDEDSAAHETAPASSPAASSPAAASGAVAFDPLLDEPLRPAARQAAQTRASVPVQKSEELRSLEQLPEWSPGRTRSRARLPRWAVALAIIVGVSLGALRNHPDDVDTGTAGNTSSLPGPSPDAGPTTGGTLEPIALAGAEVPENLQVSPDGQTISGLVRTDSMSSRLVRLWDAATGSLARRQPGPEYAEPAGIVFSADGQFVCIGRPGTAEETSHYTVWGVRNSGTYMIRWPVDQTPSPSDLDCPVAVVGGAATERRPLLALRSRGENSRPVKLVDALTSGVTGQLVLPRAMPHVTPRFNSDDCGADFSENGQVLAVPLTGSQLQLWDVPARRPLALLTLPDWFYQLRALSPDGSALAVVTANGRDLTLYDARNGHELKSVTATASSVIHALDFSTDGTLLAAAMRDGTMKVFDARALAPVASQDHALTGAGMVRDVGFTPEGNTLILAAGPPAAAYRWRFK